MTPAFEKAWQTDEAQRKWSALIKDQLRLKHKRAILEEEDRKLGEAYERPLKAMSMPRTKGKIIRFLKQFLP